MVDVWPFVNAGLLLACLGSFAWAMRRFFTQPSGETPGMKLIQAVGALFAVWHVVAVLRPAPGPVIFNGASLALYAGSLALFWWAIQTNRNRPLSAVFSPDLPSHVVQDGPYRYVRHPFYSSYLLTWVAGVAASRRPTLVLTVIVMWFIYLRATRVEEDKFARSGVSEVYHRYRKSTGRFVPSVLTFLSEKPDPSGVTDAGTRSRSADV